MSPFFLATVFFGSAGTRKPYRRVQFKRFLTIFDFTEIRALTEAGYVTLFEKCERYAWYMFYLRMNQHFLLGSDNSSVVFNYERPFVAYLQVNRSFECLPSFLEGKMSRIIFKIVVWIGNIFCSFDTRRITILFKF